MTKKGTSKRLQAKQRLSPSGKGSKLWKNCEGRTFCRQLSTRIDNACFDLKQMASTSFSCGNFICRGKRCPSDAPHFSSRIPTSCQDVKPCRCESFPFCPHAKAPGPTSKRLQAKTMPVTRLPGTFAEGDLRGTLTRFAKDNRITVVVARADPPAGGGVETEVAGSRRELTGTVMALLGKEDAARAGLLVAFDDDNSSEFSPAQYRRIPFEDDPQAATSTTRLAVRSPAGWPTCVVRSSTCSTACRWDCRTPLESLRRW